MSRTASYYELRDALAQPECAICRLKANAVDRFLDSLLWESVNDPGVRYNIRQARGFCHEHAWELARYRGSLGTTIITHDVLRSVLEVMRKATYKTLPVLSLRRAQETLNPKEPSAATAETVAQLAPQQPCLACVEAETMEEIYVTTLIENLLGQDSLLAAYQSSEGLCLPHFGQALGHVRDETVFETLVGTQRAIWDRLVSHLSEIIRKSDYRFKNEPQGEETGASLRAIAAISGARRD